VAAFGVYEQGSQFAIGWVTLQGVKSRNRSAEFGIAIGEPDARGRGFGTEATLLTLDYGFTVLGLHLIWLNCASVNERAIEVYRNVGFREGGRVREAGQFGGRRHDAVFMDILASEFRSPVLAKMLGIPGIS
jgi:RimJ/RimL family protein N-acetyltransferase